MFSNEMISQNENRDKQNIWIDLLLDWVRAYLNNNQNKAEDVAGVRLEFKDHKSTDNSSGVTDRQQRQPLYIMHVNKCVEPAKEVSELSAAGEALAEALGRYESAPAQVTAADLEPFLCRQFALLRLTDKHDDVPWKMYIVSSVVLFFCVARASGAARAAGDICARLLSRHQLLALLFCERLGGVEVTIGNVEMAIRDACELVEKYEANPDRPSISRILSDATSLGTTSNFSRLSEGDTVAAIKSLRSSVIAMQTSVEASTAGSASHVPTAIASASGASSGLLTEAGVLSESGDIIIPKAAVPEADFVRATTGKLYAEEKHVIAPSASLPAETSETTVITDMNVQMRKGGNFPFGSGDIRQGSPRVPRRVSFSRPDSFSPPPPRFRNRFPSRMLYYIQQRGYQYQPYQRRGWKPRNFLRCMSLSCCCLLVVLLLVLSFSSYVTLSAGRIKEKIHNVTAPSSSSSLVSALDDDMDNGTEVIIEVEDILKSGRSGEIRKKLWQCRDSVCQKVKGFESKPNFHSSSSRCTLLCGGPQIWPLPTDHGQFGKALVALSSKRLQYTVQFAPSDKVQKYLVQAFGYFYKDVVKLESLGKQSPNHTLDLPLKTMNIRMSVEHDPDPRLKLATDEAYLIETGTDGNQLMVYLSGSSYCGVRHGLESLSQMLMFDQSTGYIITLNSAVVKDAPSHRYRGLMLDTARNYIPIPDIIRTIDAMASVKLNTFHWRITDATSFSLLLPKFSDLFEHGAYDRSLVYTKEDVMDIAARAAVRGIRVLMELAMPGPVGRAWKWSQDVTCGNRSIDSCRNQLCLRLNVTESLFDVLQYLYTEVLEMTSVDDIFHLSDGVFSLTNCQFLMEDRKGFLAKALETLKLANHGVLPALPIVWYTSQVAEEREWGSLGVQLQQWSEGLTERLLAKFRVIQSTKWDLSCEMKNQRCYRYRTWQEMYEWRSWKSIDALSIEGGETILWTDLVNSGNLDMHVWPRAAAVAERLWADAVLNATLSASVYVRLDHHITRQRARGVAVPPLWPRWCRLEPRACLDILRL